MNPLAPDTVVDGRYRLVRRIGAGGMADVWCADDEMLNRRVALKFLLERYAEDQQFVERFRREAAAAAGLQHPNVVSVYDRGEHEGRPFIVMEYVEGASLKDLINRGLTAGEAIEIVRQVLAGARFAHARGIIHRDLKPQNVLVDREGRARVADFGIARAGPSEITQTGSVLGTAQYLSPEQAQGLETTAASDLYSIGAVLYESLTGQVPFDASTAVAIALKQVSEQPRPPSEINPNIPPALDAVVLKALAKEPENRYHSADEMLAALAAAEADPGSAPTDTATFARTVPPVVSTTAPTQPPEPVPVVEDEDEEGFWTRNRLIAAGVVALVLLGVGLYLLLSGGNAKQVRVPAVLGLQQEQATAQLEEAGFKVVPSPTPNKAQIGQVLEQDPTGGTQADEGSTVTITYSTGLGKATIPPKLAGLTVAEAEKQLRARGFKSFDVVRRFSSSVDSGKVISTDPAGGALASRSQTVTLTVSRGANLVSVPSVVGQQQSAAVAAITGANLHPTVTKQDSDSPEGEVIAQSPDGGTDAKPGSTVVITVSKGPAPIVLPNVVGQPAQDAIATLKSHGVPSANIVVQRQDTSDQSTAGIVSAEAPPGGSRVLATDQVILTVGHFVPATTTTPSTTTTPAKPRSPGKRG